jgi:CheY-like chemotaxis protein
MDRDGASPPYLLLIEDRPADVQLLTAALLEGASTLAVHAVATVTAAVSWLRGEGPAASRRKPALIVVDLHLHGAPGTAALIRLQATDAWKRIPVVVLTGSGDPRSREECRRLGARDYLVKPMDFAGYLLCAQELARCVACPQARAVGA